MNTLPPMNRHILSSGSTHTSFPTPQFCLVRYRKTAFIRRAACRVLGGALVAGLVGLAGCATPQGYQVAGKSSSTAADASTEVAEVRAAVERAVLALDGLEERGTPPNPRTALDTFSAAVAAADASWTRAGKAQADLVTQTDAYFRDWAQKTAVIENERMRDAANNRRREMMDTMSRLRDQFTETKAAFEPYLGRLKGLRTMLQNDFTDAGVRAASRSIKETRDRAGDARSSLDKLAEVAEEVADAFSTVSVAGVGA